MEIEKNWPKITNMMHIQQVILNINIELSNNKGKLQLH